MQPVPYWRLSGFYFFYFAVLGGLVPYWSLYLRHLEFTAPEIGFLTAIVLATKMVAPNLWGWLADHTGQRVRIIRLGAFLAAVFFLGIFIHQGFVWFALVIGLYTFFWNAILPQYEVLTLASLAGRYQYYSLIRLWGSVGFIAAVVLLGMGLDWLSIVWLPHALAIMLAGIWLCSLTVRAGQVPPRTRRRGGFARILRQPVVLVFFACCFLMQLGHGPYYTFFSIYLQQHGVSASTTGWLWALGVVAEVLLFLVMHRLMPALGLRRLFLISLGLAALRWLLIGFFVDCLPVLLLAQCLHAASFGSFHAVAIELVRRFFAEGYQGQGQALYSALSFGAGGAVGAAASGLIWDSSPLLAFVMASVACALAFVLAWLFLRHTLLEARA